ncbi:MAG: TetR/AcrR family transcriptional regulator [Acidobacteriota bacterium]|nr:TetR/AcrR family transcriptional regulator [Acidobacteriota bacterium]
MVEPKGNTKKRRIIEAAVTVIIEQGYAEAGLAEIALRAEVTRGTLFKLFGNKIAIVMAYQQQRLAEALEVLEPDEDFPSYPLADRLAALMQTHQVLLRPDREFLEKTAARPPLPDGLVLDSHFQEQLTGAMESIIHMGLDESYREAPFHKLLPSWCAFAYRFILDYWLNDLSENYYKTSRLTRFITRILANLWEDQPAFAQLSPEDFPEPPYPVPNWSMLLGLLEGLMGTPTNPPPRPEEK